MDMDEDLEEIYDELSYLSVSNKEKEANCLGFQFNWKDDGEEIEEETDPHETPSKEILWAAENGKIEMVNSLLDSNSHLVESVDKDGYTPLHRASYNNHSAIVKVLLQRGASHSAQTIDGWQPLHSACKWNNVNCAKHLIAFGADVNATSKGGVTPLHLAARHIHGGNLIKLLLLHPEKSIDSNNDMEYTSLDIATNYKMNPTIIA